MSRGCQRANNFRQISTTDFNYCCTVRVVVLRNLIKEWNIHLLENEWSVAGVLNAHTWQMMYMNRINLQWIKRIN